MRLTPEEVSAIKRSAQEVFGVDVLVRVFGSRLDDSRRGGDIDLYVQSAAGCLSLEAAGKFRRLLDRNVGEREYDIIIAGTGQPTTAIGRKALAEGVLL